MQHDSLMIHCPNMQCRAANPEEQTFCLKCHTRLPKRYLKVVNFSDQEFALGDILADRFVFRGPQVVLDVRPGLLLSSDYEIPSLFLPYLKLFPHRIHYSQFFTVLWVGEKEQAPILLLDKAPLCPKDLAQAGLAEEDSQRLAVPVATALPLKQAWPQARPLRQLNWLWQITKLWDSFLAQGVAQSLITPALLRVEGPLLRVLELHNDLPEAPPTLVDLGTMLSQFKSATSGSINFLFAEVCDELVEGKITETATLAARLEDIIVTCRDSQAIQVSLATQTDPGMVRTHNEDQCFPASGSYIQNSTESLLIVCDGVGGHAGGEVASAIAIEAMQEHLSNVILDTLSPAQIKQELIAACCHANDLISERNDQEQRQERARMGTTLVMALIHDHQLYIAHIGDSRAYLITKVGCYQLTVDDDIASREVRLGYLPYYEALRQPTSGSLVQALGMASSNTLHPTVQRFILDDECVLLLCSDGLSDYDRVEELWQEELLPLLYRNYDLSSVSQRLITLANHLNGHDNVTVGLMNMTYGQGDTSQPVTVKRADLDFKATAPNLNDADREDKAWIPSDQEPSESFPTPDQTTRRQKRKRSPFLLLSVLGLLAVLTAGSVWAAFKLLPRLGVTVEADNPPLPTPEPPPPIVEEIEPNQFFEVSNPNGLKVQLRPPTPLPISKPADGSAAMPVLPQGSVLKVVDLLSEPSSENSSAENWLEVQLCDRPDSPIAAPQAQPPIAEPQTPGTEPNAPIADPQASETDPLAPVTEPLQKGDPAWVEKAALQQAVIRLSDPDLTQFGLDGCNKPSGEGQARPDSQPLPPQ